MPTEGGDRTLLQTKEGRRMLTDRPDRESPLIDRGVDPAKLAEAVRRRSAGAAGGVSTTDSDAPPEATYEPPLLPRLPPAHAALVRRASLKKRPSLSGWQTACEQSSTSEAEPPRADLYRA